MCFARSMRFFFCSFFFFKGTCDFFIYFFFRTWGRFFYFLFYFIGTWGSFGCVHGEVRSFIEYGVVL